MDLASLLIGALAAGIIEQIVADLSARPQFRRIRDWLCGDEVRPHFECALARAVAATAKEDRPVFPWRNRRVFSWRYLNPALVAPPLAQAIGWWNPPKGFGLVVGQAWSTVTPPEDRKHLTTLAVLLVEGLREALKADPELAAVLNAGSLWQAQQAIAAWPKQSGSIDAIRRTTILTLRGIDDFWEGSEALPPELAASQDIPFAVRVPLSDGRNNEERLIIYPGERAIILLDGRSVGDPLGPGPLSPRELYREFGGRSARSQLEAVIYSAETMTVRFEGIEARSAEDERVLVTCDLLFLIKDAVPFQTEFVKRQIIYGPAQFRAELRAPVCAAVQQFMRERRFEEVEASDRAKEHLAVLLQEQLNRPEYRLNKAGVKFDGLKGWRPESPAVRAARSVADPLDEQIAQLEAMNDRLPRYAGLRQELERWLQQVPRPVGPLPPLRLPEPPPLQLLGEASVAPEPVAWEFPPAGSTLRLVQLRARPVIAGSRVYLADYDGAIHCVDLNTGTPYAGWQAGTLPGKVFGHPAYVADGPSAPTLLVPCTDGKLYSLHGETGAVQGAWPTGGWLRAEPLIAGGWVYTACGAGDRWGGGVVAHRLGDGREMGRWHAPDPCAVVGAPVLDEDGFTLFFATVDLYGNTVYRADIRRPGAKLIFSTRGPVRARLLRDPRRDCLYVISQAGVVHAIKPDGRELWSRQLAGQVEVDAVASDKALYVGTDKGYVHVLNLDARGAEIWPRFEARGAITTPPVLDDQFLGFGSADGAAYEIECSSWWMCREFQPGGQVDSFTFVQATGAWLVGYQGKHGAALRCVQPELASTAPPAAR